MIDYKKIFIGKRFRIAFLRMFNWVPDTYMVRFQYWLHFGGRKLHLENPVRYTEKVQHYKCFYRNPIMGICVDKYRVREYVKSKGREDSLVKLIGVYHNVDEIQYESLPEKFVIKTNDGGASIGVLICRDKKNFDWEAAKKTIAGWNHKLKKHPGREWAYSMIKEPVITIEEYMENKENLSESPNDYKIMCFDGKVQVFWVETERTIGLKRNYYDRDLNPLDVHMVYPSNAKYVLPEKRILHELFDLAEVLAADFPHVRVDLYYTDKPVFGELTFYTDSGYGTFDPDSYDTELGKLFNINYREFNVLKQDARNA